ncbi:hypothetical protein D3C73_1420730 [compost metagenome]
MITRQRTGCGDQTAIRHAIRQILHNRHAFGQQAAIIQQQRRDLSFRVDGQIVRTAFGLFQRQIDLFCGEVQACFAQYNMGGQRTGAGFIEQFHRKLLDNDE